jgi:riboflavin biosynthesis pyrimidine reductase
VSGDPIVGHGPGFEPAVRDLVHRLVAAARGLDPENEDLPSDGPRLEVLYENRDLPRFALPRALSAAYGGAFGLESPRLFANFVASADGVVSLPEGPEPGQVISGGSSSDRFVMGLLRAAADTVVVGAGTFRRTPRHVWLAETIYPPAAAAFQAMRKRLALEPKPRFVLVTGSGDIDARGPALDGAVVATTRAAAARLSTLLPSTAQVLVAGEDRIDLTQLMTELRLSGSRRVLTEGGPRLFTELAHEGQLHEVFLTLSPSLLGRFDGDRRLALTAGMDLLPLPLILLSARRDSSHLFLRYALDGDAQGGGRASPGG